MPAPGYESITVSNTAIGFTASLLKSGEVKASSAFITAEDSQVRCRMDGTDPTSSEGHILNNGNTMNITDPDAIANFKAIRTGSTDGTLKVTYEYNLIDRRI